VGEDFPENRPEGASPPRDARTIEAEIRLKEVKNR
jgi:hypothetical protein